MDENSETAFRAKSNYAMFTLVILYNLFVCDQFFMTYQSEQIGFWKMFEADRKVFYKVPLKSLMEFESIMDGTCTRVQKWMEVSPDR